MVVLGGGFAGLYTARMLAGHAVRLTVVDRKNHHTFQPLLYQVASAVLSPADIASPIRSILRGHANLEVILDEAVGFDLEGRKVRLKQAGELAYDFLIVAAGAGHSYFGHDDWEPSAPGLKTLEDALEIRRRVLLAFELAERRAAQGEAAEPPVFVVIGGGATGVELAGALADIARHALRHEFRRLDTARSRVILLEGDPRVLPAFPEDLSRSAEEQLRGLGVEVRTSAMVTHVAPGVVWVASPGEPEQTPIGAAVVLWAAGIAASPLGRMTGAPVDKAGRVLVEPDLSLPGRSEVFVAGDLAAVKNADGSWVPGVAPAAIQMGRAAAGNILRTLAGKPRQAFRYRDRGVLATIGRAAAVADLRGFHVAGRLAWLLWLFVHIFFLIGFRNRLLVMIQWAWAYLTRQRPARLITGSTELPR